MVGTSVCMPRSVPRASRQVMIISMVMVIVLLMVMVIVLLMVMC